MLLVFAFVDAFVLFQLLLVLVFVVALVFFFLLTFLFVLVLLVQVLPSLLCVGSWLRTTFSNLDLDFGFGLHPLVSTSEQTSAL